MPDSDDKFAKPRAVPAPRLVEAFTALRETLELAAQVYKFKPLHPPQSVRSVRADLEDRANFIRDIDRDVTALARAIVDGASFWAYINPDHTLEAIADNLSRAAREVGEDDA